MWNDINLSKKEEIQSKKNSIVVALSILILIFICLSVSYLFILAIIWESFVCYFWQNLKLKNHQTSKSTTNQKIINKEGVTQQILTFLSAFFKEDTPSTVVLLKKET